MPEQAVNPFGQIVKDTYTQAGVDYTPTDNDIKAIQEQYKGDHRSFLKDFYKQAEVGYELNDDDFKSIDEHYGISKPSIFKPTKEQPIDPSFVPGPEFGYVDPASIGLGVSGKPAQTRFTQEDIDDAKNMLPVMAQLRKESAAQNTRIPNRLLPDNTELDKVYPKPQEELGYTEPEVLGQSRSKYISNDLLDKTGGYYKAIADGDSNASSRFVNGLKNTDLANLITFGVKNMGQDVDIYAASQRYSEGKATADDKNLLLSKALLEEVSSKAQNDRATSVGTGLADMAPWLAQFALSGGTGTAVTASTEKALSSMMAKNLMGKVAGKFASGVAGTAAQTAVQVPMMVSGTAQRMTDQYQLQDGDLQKTKEGEAFGEALAKTYGNNFLEVYSERVFGNAVDKFGTKMISQALDSKVLAGTKVKDIINSARNNKYVKLTNTTLGLNTPLTENIEEAFTGLTQPLVTEDGWEAKKEGISDYFTKENLVRTFLTTAVMGAGMGAVQAPGQIYTTVKSEKGKKIVDSFDETQSGLWNQALSAETIEERKEAFIDLWDYNAQKGSSKSDLNSMMHYYQTAVSEQENNRETSANNVDTSANNMSLVGSSETRHPNNLGSSAKQSNVPTIDPRQAKESELKQYADYISNKLTGTIQVVKVLTPWGHENEPKYIVASAEDGSMRLMDDNGKMSWAKKENLVGDMQEMSVDDFVKSQLSSFDQTQKQKGIERENKMLYNGKLLTRRTDRGETKTEDGEYWFDENEQEYLIPDQAVKDWEKSKAIDPKSTPKIVSYTYRKTKISGIKNQQGDILVSEPATNEQVKLIKQEVEKGTGGNATVVAELIPTNDATIQQLYQLRITPVVNKDVPATENNKTTAQPPNQNSQLETKAPDNRKSFSIKVGNDEIGLVENKDFDEVIPSDKMPLEKALPVLEKKFKDHPKFELQVEKSQVEIPGETKWDDTTYQTVVKSIKIVPKKKAETTPAPVKTDLSYAPATSEGVRVENTTTVNPVNVNSVALKDENTSGLLQSKGVNDNFTFDVFRTTRPTIEEMKSKVDELQKMAPNSAPVFLAKTVDELPAAIRDNANFTEGIYGVFYNGKVYILANSIKSMDHFIAIWVHENGIHNGLRNILPAYERRQLMEHVYDSFADIAKRKPEYRQMFGEIVWNYSGQWKSVKGEELLAKLAEIIVSEKDLKNIRPEIQSAWNEIREYLRYLLSKVFNFNGNLLTEDQLDELIFISIQSNFQSNEHASSNPERSGEIRQGEQRFSNGSKGNSFRSGDDKNQSDERMQDQDGQGRLLDRNRVDTILKEAKIKDSKPDQGLDDNTPLFAVKDGKKPLLSLLFEAKQKKRSPERVRTNIDRFASRFIDGNKAVKVLLEKFDLKVPDFANVYLSLNQKSSRQMGQKTQFERKLYNPLLKSIANIIDVVVAKDGITKDAAYEKVKTYMMARHAPERNAWFQSIGKKGDNFSGMTDEQAQTIYEEFESQVSAELIDGLWTNTRKCTERISRYWVDYGRYDQSSIDSVTARDWKYYVPLRGFEPIAEEIELDYERSLAKSDFAGNDKAEGRESMADDPIAYIYNMADSAIMWGEKNKVKRTAYNLVKINYNRSDLFELAQVNYMKDQMGIETEVVYEKSGTYTDSKGKEKPEYKVFLMNIDNDGNTKKTELGAKSELEAMGYSFSSVRNVDSMNEKPTYLKKQHEVEVYIEGDRFKIIFKDPAIANAINGNNYSQAINYKWLPMAQITRFMARGVTSWRPSFITSNTYRDFKTGSKTMFIQRGFKDGLKFQAKYGVAAKFLASNMLNDVWRSSSDKADFFLNILGVEPKTPEEIQWKTWYDEFNLNGGPTGHSYLMPLDEVKSKFGKYIDKIKRSKTDAISSFANPLNALKLMEGLAGYGESIARFTAYVMARQRGESIMSSINEAKEITTNFDVKGEYAPTIGSFIMFFNATVQGAAKQYDMAKNHAFRYFAINAVSLVVQGIISRYVWDLMNGDDDDKDYAEISKYTKYNNTVLGWKDNYVTIPLPQGFRVWNALGVALYEHQMGRLTTEQLSFDMAEMFSQSLSPVEFGGIFDKDGKISAPKVVGTLVTPLEPLMDVYINEDFRKKPIFREPFMKGDEGKHADSQMYLNRTNFALVSFTDWMYKKAGGDSELGTKTTKGKRIDENFDWNPAKIEYILKSYTGGPGETILDAANYLTLKIVDDVDKRIKDPEHKIEGFDPTSIPILQSYYHKKYTGFIYNEYRELANDAAVLKFEFDKRNSTRKPGKILEFTLEQRELIYEYEIIDGQLKSLSEYKKMTNNEDILKAIDLQILGIRRGFVSKYKYFGKE